MEFKRVDDIVIGLVKQAVESEWCQLADVDVESLIARIQGPNEIVGDCAKAVEDILR